MAGRSTCTRRCCRAGAAPRRSRTRSSPATARPASRSWKGRPRSMKGRSSLRSGPRSAKPSRLAISRSDSRRSARAPRARAAALHQWRAARVAAGRIGSDAGAEAHVARRRARFRAARRGARSPRARVHAGPGRVDDVPRRASRRREGVGVRRHARRSTGCSRSMRATPRSRPARAGYVSTLVRPAGKRTMKGEDWARGLRDIAGARLPS